MSDGTVRLRVVGWMLPVVVIAACIYLNVCYRRDIVRLAPEIGAGAATAAECQGWPFPSSFILREDERAAYTEGMQRMSHGEMAYHAGHLRRGFVWNMLLWLLAIVASATPALLASRRQNAHNLSVERSPSKS